MDKEIERIEVKEAEAVDQEPQMSVKDKKPRGKTVKAVLLTLLVIVLMGASAGAAYMYRDNSAKDTEKEQSDQIAALKIDKKKLEKELANVSEGDESIVGCPAIAPNLTALDNIKASITSANTAALEGYMATSVNVILAASEAYGPQTPAQAIADISSFLGDDNAAWDYDFSLPAATIDSYQNGDYDEYFTDISVIGKNGQNKVISFSFNCEAKIGTVFMSSSEDIL